MPPPPPVLDVYQVTTIGLLNSMPCDHVINWHVPGLSASAGAVALNFATTDAVAWMANFQLELPPYYTHVASSAKYLGAGAPPASVTTAGLSGTSAESFGSHAVCATVRHHVPVAGRGRQGRTNIPGPPSLRIDQPSGQISVAARNAYIGSWTSYTNQISTAITSEFGISPSFVVLSRKTGTYLVPDLHNVDLFPNTHRRWQKRLARH